MMCMLYVILCNPETSLALIIDHVEIKYILLNIYKELFCPQVDSIGWTVMTVVFHISAWLTDGLSFQVAKQ